jgi:transcriptional regulator with XRE-family HTH domain
MSATAKKTFRNKETFMKHITGEELREYRNRKGMKQAVIAKAIGVTASQISKWEKGKMMISQGYQLALQHYFNGELELQKTEEIQFLLEQVKLYKDLSERYSKMIDQFLLDKTEL